MIDRAFREADAAFDWFKHQLRSRREPGCYHIQPYRGFGTADSITVSGRVLEGDSVPAARQDDALFRNFWHSVRRLSSDEVPLATVRATRGQESVTVTADYEGFFSVELPQPEGARQEGLWHEVDLELIDPAPQTGPVTARGHSLIPASQARFGVISDIDDTVVQTDVANLLRMVRLVLLTNAHTRLPFEGVADFYHALHRGAGGPRVNPLFYVSSSPWNLYDLLTEVFDVHRVPSGPMLLKDYGIARDLLLSRGHVEHKLEAIARILTTYPGLPFILVGDSGQKDPEIYLETVRRHPGRISAIYVRDVRPDDRDRELHDITAQLAGLGVEMILSQDTLGAAEHAAARGFIDPEALLAVRGGRAADREAPGAFGSVVRGK
ncbi:MAG: phosphatase domain-containing protein [Gemmatimonadota bacterium]